MTHKLIMYLIENQKEKSRSLSSPTCVSDLKSRGATSM